MPRPRIAVKDRNTEMIVVKVDPATKKELVAMAEGSDMKLGPFCRRVLKRHCKAAENLRERV